MREYDILYSQAKIFDKLYTGMDKMKHDPHNGWGGETTTDHLIDISPSCTRMGKKIITCCDEVYLFIVYY